MLKVNVCIYILSLPLAPLGVCAICFGALNNCWNVPRAGKKGKTNVQQGAIILEIWCRTGKCWERKSAALPPSTYICLCGDEKFSFASVDSKKRKLYSGPKAKAKSIYKTYRLSLPNQRRDVRLYILFSGKVFPSIVRFVFIVTAG